MRLLVLLLVACNGSKQVDSGKIDATKGAGNSCGPNPPVIDTFTIADAGMSTSGDQCGSTVRPQILLSTHVTDQDFDLSYVVMKVWYDDVQDGTVAESGQDFHTSMTVNGASCQTPDATIGMKLCITGNPPFSTPLEFGVEIDDDAGHASNEAIATFTTPDENGNYGS